MDQDENKVPEKKGFLDTLKDKILPGKKADPAAEKGKSVLPVIDTIRDRKRRMEEAIGATDQGKIMEEKSEYAGAWSDGEEAKSANPVTEAVVAARKADGDAFADAFENDKFGIDVETVAKEESKPEVAPATEAEKA